MLALIRNAVIRLPTPTTLQTSSDDLLRRRAIWFGGADRKEESMDLFYRELGANKSSRIRLAVMDMWKAFRNSAARNAPQARILFDKFHVMAHLGKALDERSEE